MDRDPGIVSFTHCSGLQVFSCSVPHKCPICQDDLEESTNLMPVRVPYPFVNASQQNCSVVIRPTQGDFLSDYTPGDDLHIGVTSSRGKVYEYDSEGIHRGSRGKQWVRSVLVLEFLHELDGLKQYQWDDTLDTMAAADAWSMSKYDEERYNCFSFLFAFFREVPFASDLNLTVASKVNFCELYVSHKLSMAYKYISVHRAVMHYGYFVSPNDRTLSLVEP